MTIEFENIPNSLRRPGKYFEFNAALANRSLPQNRQKLCLVGQRDTFAVGEAFFRDAGLDDMSASGAYTGSRHRKIVVEIDGTGTPDSFRWSNDGGNTWFASTVAITGSGQTLAEGIIVTFAATTGHTLGDQWVFWVRPEPAVAEAVVTEIFSDDEAALKFGYGSHIHLMAMAALKANARVALYVCALDPSEGTAATGTVAVTANSKAGSLTLWVGNQEVTVAVIASDTSSTLADKLADAINDMPSLPLVCTGVAGAGSNELALAAKCPGTQGNGISLDYETGNLAASCAITAMASGDTDPDLVTALDVIYPDTFDLIAVSLNELGNLQDLDTHVEEVSGPQELRPSVAVYGYTGALAACTTLANTINEARILCAYLRGSRSHSMEIAAAMASIMAWEEDPARPLNTLELSGLHTPTLANRFTVPELESLLYNGVTPLAVGVSEAVRVVRAISTYILSDAGVPDTTFLDITTIRTLDYTRKAVHTRLALRFPRSKNTAAIRASIKSETYAVLKQLEALEILENVDANMDGLVVEQNAADPNRADVKIPADVVNGLHVLAGRIDLLI